MDSVGLRRGNKRLAMITEYGFVIFVTKDFRYDGDLVIDDHRGIELNLNDMTYFEDEELGGCYINDEYIVVLGDYLGIIGQTTIEKAFMRFHGK